MNKEERDSHVEKVVRERTSWSCTPEDEELNNSGSYLVPLGRIRMCAEIPLLPGKSLQTEIVFHVQPCPENVLWFNVFLISGRVTMTLKKLLIEAIEAFERERLHP